MRFGVLGSLQAWDGARAIELGPLRRRAVLAALLVDAGHVVTSQTLLDRAWNGRPPGAATNALQAYISRLRAVLMATDASAPATIRTTPRGYALDVARDDVDAYRFLDLAERARVRRDEGDLLGADELIGTALQLWRGPAYQDFDLDFAVTESRRLAEARLDAQTLAVQIALDLGRHDDQLLPLRALRNDHPMHEQVSGLLMTALYRAGRQAEALQVFRQTRELLADELGVDPGADLQALHTAILRQDPRLVAPTPAPTPRTETAERGSVKSGRDRLIGRADELRLIEAGWAEAGGTQFVLVVGEAGVGKSRLVEEAAARNVAAGGRAVWGRCWPYDGAPALWPWIQIVRDLVSDIGDAARGRLAGPLEVLRTLVPELRPAPADDMVVSPPASLDAAQVRLFDAVATLLSVASEAAHLTVVVEDLQWADAASGRLLEYLTEHLRPGRVTVLVTVRSPTPDGGPADRDVLAGLARHHQVRRIDLTPLPAHDVHRLVSDRLGTEPDEATTRALHERTAGNPFYIGEIVRLVLSTGTEQALVQGIPETVRGVIVSRLASLSDTDRVVLSTAAMVGRTFDLELIVAVTGASDDDVEEAVDRATAAGLLRSEPGTLDHHRFTHALLQETLLGEIGPARRRRLHRLVARALDARRTLLGDHVVGADRVAHHFAAAGGPADLEQATELYLAAVDDAARVGNFLEIETLLQTVHELIKDADAVRPALRATVRLRLSSFYLVHAGVFSDASRGELRVPDSERLGEDASNRDLLMAYYLEWAKAHGAGDVAGGQRVTKRLTQLADTRHDDQLRLGALLTQGYDTMHAGRLLDAVDAFDELGRLSARTDVPGMVFTPHPAVAGPLWGSGCLHLLGRHDEGEAAFASAVAQAETVGEQPSWAFVHGANTLFQVWLDDPDATLRAAMEASRAINDASMWIIGVYMAMPTAWATARHDLTRGRALADEAADTIEGYDGFVFRPFLRGVYAQILLWCGEPDRALERLDVALAESRRTGDVFYDAELYRLQAEALRASGAALDQVQEAVDLGLDIAREHGAVLFEQRLELAAVQA